MRIHPGKKAWPAAPLLFLGVLLLGTYLGRKEIFLLNKNVRLVSFRLMKYEELARHRVYIYRMQFFADYFRVDARPLDPGKGWREIAVFPYERGVGTTMPGFTLEIDRGRIVSYYWGKKTEKLKSTMILTFFHRKKPWRQRGIQYFDDGFWRVLKSYDAGTDG